MERPRDDHRDPRGERCSLCREPVEEERYRAYCERCGAVAHRTCREELGDCPTLGCPGSWAGPGTAFADAPAAEPASAPARRGRSTRRLVAVVVSLVLVGAGALVVRDRRAERQHLHDRRERLAAFEERRDAGGSSPELRREVRDLRYEIIATEVRWFPTVRDALRARARDLEDDVERDVRFGESR